MLDRSNRVWLGEFSTIASWDTIDNANNLMYIIEQLDGVLSPRIVQVTTGPHDLDSLAASLQASLNGPGKMAGLGVYYVTRVDAGDSAASGVLARAYQVNLSHGTFRIQPDVDVQASFDVPLVDSRSMSRIFSFPFADFAGSAESGFVDLRRCHQIFIHTTIHEGQADSGASWPRFRWTLATAARFTGTCLAPSAIPWSAESPI